ncbi:MAG TPA: MDR family MFS transporter [Solirubrobacteraceae bacterium]|nr:MDR family MFS transporter [Solirubrobacteraceae bacterium]
MLLQKRPDGRTAMHASTETNSAGPGPSGLGDHRLRAAFAGLLTAMFIGALDQTIMATALPTIAGQLGGLTELSWVVTAYVLAAAASTPLWGKASDLLGRKRLIAGALVAFVGFSMLSGTASTIGWLVAFRALQGIGAGGVMTLATASVADLVPPRERGRYQGYIQLTFLVASLAGPLLGGLFVDQLSWRWAFYVNVPIGVVALSLLAAYLPAGEQRREARLDYAGAALLAGLVVAIMLIATWGGSQYRWGSPAILGLIAVAVALLGAFVRREQAAAEPVLPLRLFADRVFTVVSAAAFVATLSLFAAIVFLPVFLQLVTGASATLSGLLTLPLLGASALTTIAAGQIMTRTGRYKIFPVIGLAAMSTGLFLFSTLGATGSRLEAALFMVVFGAGFGMVTQILMVAIQNAVTPREIGTATASANLFRALGGSVGVAIYGAVFAAGLRHWLPFELHGRIPRGVTAAGIQAAPDRIHALTPTIQHAIAQAVGNSLHDVFLLAAPIALAGFFIVLALREQPLRGRQQAAQPQPVKPDSVAPPKRIAA